ncbi:Major facilitator superfamily domain, general substrate transporter [Moelleriella libera RCEF 2490]|uniref:Major facilitator superfamily domain, general substrate transporter n=1 Tax=Moelleriella libera RCEF 2490 TaxID=1081109 RepID=A0A167ZM70_9HYPO|nr:Major facilitator superfamily domain, general substrate transporter [Moelleriella libera RCEF 2490]
MDPEKTTPGILRPDAERQEQIEGEGIFADTDKHKQDVAAGSVTNVDDFASDIVVDPIIEKRILRRLDASLAPLFCVLYFLSYLDRSNIGNAAVAGLSDQLELSGPQLSTSISVFYATYVSLIVPIVLAVRWLKTNRAVSVMLLSWSLVTIGTAFVRHYHSLIVCRLILGICEAGLFPCISLYITSIYNPREQGLRNAYLFGAASLSGMFGGLVATGITKISSAGTLRGWSWLYIIEGLVSICVVPWAYFGLPEFPAKSKRWTAEELETLERRELKRQEYMGNYEFDWSQVWSTFKDWRLYTGCAIQFFQDIILYGFTSFLPSIIKGGLGYDSLQAQYLGVPVYFLGGVALFSAALAGDRWGLRGTIIFVCDAFAVAGYIILLAVESPGVRYFACYLVAIALFCGPGLNETWIVNNTAPHYRRATALGMCQTLGNIAGVVAPQVYRQAPYRLGHWFSLGSVIMCMILIAIQIVYFRSENRRKEEMVRGERPDDRNDKSGEHNLNFRYVY